jgi:hypothetical protein
MFQFSSNSGFILPSFALSGSANDADASAVQRSAGSGDEISYECDRI